MARASGMPGIASHTPPQFTPGSYEMSHMKRARAGSVSGRLRSASDLEDIGLIDKSQKGVMKDLIISGDAELQLALDKYEKGDPSELEILLQKGLLDRKDSSLDLLLDLNLGLLTMDALSSSVEIGSADFGATSTLLLTVKDEELSQGSSNGGDDDDEDDEDYTGDLDDMPFRCDDDYFAMNRGYESRMAMGKLDEEDESPTTVLQEEEGGAAGERRQGGKGPKGHTGGKSGAIGPLPIKVKSELLDRKPDAGMEVFSPQFQFPFTNDVNLDLGAGLKEELRDLEVLADPSAPKQAFPPREASSGTASSQPTLSSNAAAAARLAGISPAAPSRVAVPNPATDLHAQRNLSLPVPVATAEALALIGGGGRKGGLVGAYSPNARKKRIQRFMEKREQRVWTKTVKYDVRKNFADTRMRVKGRFVRKEDEALLRELMALA